MSIQWGGIIDKNNQFLPMITAWTSFKIPAIKIAYKKIIYHCLYKLIGIIIDWWTCPIHNMVVTGDFITPVKPRMYCHYHCTDNRNHWITNGLFHGKHDRNVEYGQIYLHVILQCIFNHWCTVLTVSNVLSTEDQDTYCLGICCHRNLVSLILISLSNDNIKMLLLTILIQIQCFTCI